MEKILLRKRCIAAFAAITMAVGLMPNVTMAAETAEISCSVDGAKNVTNVGESGYITIDFSTDMNISTLNSGNITIKNGEGTEIKYTADVTARQYKIDKKYFSNIKDNGVATTLTGDTFTISVANTKTADETEQETKTFSFTTGTVLPVSYKEDCVIENVALGKTVKALGTVPESGDKAEYVTDGKQNNDWNVYREKVSAAGDAAFQIDLGRKYDIAGVAVAGGVGTSFDPNVNSALWLSRYHLVGGSNQADITKMSEVATTYIKSGNTWMTYDQVRAKFFDGKTEQIRYIYGGTEQSPYSLYREIYVWAYVQPENLIESTYPENGETGVTNIGAGNNTLVTIDFSEDMNTTTLNSKSIVITNSAGDVIDYTPYSAETRKYSIDKKYFSSVKDNGAVTNLDGDTFTVTVNGAVAQNGTVQKKYSFSFTTGTVLPVSYKEGYIIENVALGKTVSELGKSKVSGDMAEYVTDSRQFDEWKVFRENVERGNAAFSVDLGKKYNIAGVAIAGSNKDWYDQDQIVGGGNEPNKTAMRDVTEYIGTNANRIAWNQVKAKFFDYGATDAVRYIYAGSSGTCLACRELYAWAYIKTENTVDSTYPENGAKNVSNVGAGNNSLVTVNFNTDMDTSTLTPENVTVKNSKGEKIDYVPYSVSPRQLTIDKKYFSSIKDNGAVTTLDGDKFTVSINGAKSLNGDSVTYYSFSFSTGIILPVSYKAGYAIENVALGKSVTGLGTSKIDGDEFEYVTDGRQFNEWRVLREKVIPGNAAFKVDLEKQYDIAGIAIAGVNNQHYDRNQIIGGSNSGDKTVMSDVSTYIKADINTIDWNQVKARFYDYGKTEPVQYIYAGSSQEWLACRELYVWAYVQSGELNNVIKTMQPANETKNITNVTNTALNNFVYTEDCITVNFADNTDMSTVTNETLTLSQKKEPNIKYNLVVDGDKHEAKIPLSDLSSMLDYTLTVTDRIKTSDGSSATPEQLTFSTGEIAKIPYTAGKTVKNSALNKSVTLSDGTVMNKYTNGLLRGYDGNAESIPQYKDENPIYAIIDLGEEKTVLSLSTDGSENSDIWQSCSNLEFYGTNNIYYDYIENDGAVTAKVNLKTLQEADKLGYFSAGLAKTTNTPVITVDGKMPYRYILLKKASDGDAHLSEVMVYTEETMPNIQICGFEVQNEQGYRIPYTIKDGETAKAVAEIKKNSADADNAILVIAQYGDNGKMSDVKLTDINAADIGLYQQKKYSVSMKMQGSGGSIKAFLLSAENISPLVDSYGFSSHNFFDDSLFDTQISYDEAKNVEKSGGTYYTGYDISDDNYNIKAIFYDGVTVDGKNTKVFAYMGLPKSASEANPVPAVVCVHGGGGTAYSEWVKKWNDRGYAAIAMDLYEKGPDGEKHNYGADIPTYAGSRAFSADLDKASLKYNVMDIIYANNLLRGIKEIDSNKIGIAGVSWGGVATAITCGVDQRFAFAIANYGCGYLEKSRTSFNAMINNPNASIVWDPINFAANATMPVMYLTGDNDWYFSLDSAAASAKSTPNGRLCAIHNMGHSNTPIFYNEQAYTFANDCVNGTAAYADIISEKSEGKNITVSYKAPAGTEVVDAKLYYITTAEIPYNQYSATNYYTWTESVNPCAFTGSEIQATAPNDAKLCYISIKDSKGMITSSGLIKVD